MPFLAPAVAWVGGLVSSVAAWAAASPILAGIAQTAFGIALKYAINALFPPKTQSRASELETQYGANIPRSVILGTCATEGHHIYRNSYGSGGRQVQDVFVLSSFRITAVPRVRYNGKWRELVDQDADGYWLVPNEGTSGDDHDNVRVKFYYGTMDQQAEPTLINQARPAGRWTVNHRGAGVAYAVVLSGLRKNGDGLTSPAKLLFEVVGAPLYDWRKDSTMGGSGPHRWDNQATWEYSDNPAVQIYNLERGFFNGAQRMVGKGVRSSRLPLAEYTQAANICDEVMSDGSKRYRAHAIAKDGPGANHDANLTPILEAMCGTWVERVDGEFPIAGATQAIVATITDDDIKRGAPLRFTAKRKRTELINTVAASYISPDDFYETKDAATRIDAGALAEDRETLASAIPYGAVTDPRQVDRLADIAIRGARYQASAEITVHPKFLATIKEGRWVRWNSAKYGDRTFQVLTRQLGGINTDGARDIALSLQEISNGVFDPTAYETTPPTIIVVPPPQYLAEVQNFDVIPIIVKADGVGELPGARLIWDPIDDISVVGVDIEYWPANDPTQVFRKFVTADIVNVPIVEGLTSLTDWFVRTKLRVDNGRAVAWAAAKPFRTLNAQSDLPPIDFDHLAEDIKNYMEWASDARRYVLEELDRIGNLASIQEAANFTDKQQLRRELTLTAQNITASYKEEITVATGPGSALVTSITTLQTAVAGKADNSVVSALASTVTTQGETITSQGSSILALQNAMPGKADASALTALTTTVTSQGNSITANTNAITDLQSTVNGVTASATFRMGTVAAPSGWSSRGAIQFRVNTGDTYKNAGLYFDVTQTQARTVLTADQIVFSNGSQYYKPFVIVNNVMYGEGFVMNWASIENAVTQNFVAETANIGALAVKTSNLDFNQVTETYQSSLSWSNSDVIPNGEYCHLSVSNPQANTVLVSFFVKPMTTTLTGGSGINGTSRFDLVNLTTGEVFDFRGGSWNGPGSGDQSLTGTFVDINAASGTNVYAVRKSASTGSFSYAGTIKIRALVWKR